MRLICPNCDAQYEVDVSAIPAVGRDVQCSNCGHAWFQAADVTASAPPHDHDAEDSGLSQDRSDVQLSSQPLPQRRSIDESVLSVLREEAEREAIARRADAATLEMQGELVLAPPVKVPPAPVLPSAEPDTRLSAVADRPAPFSRPTARRDLLPDIEEINSTLSPSTRVARDKVDDDDLPDLTDSRTQRSGFRSGFVLMLVLAGLAMVLYIMAPQIAQQIPGTAEAMTAYVSAVDAARLWLDTLIRQATGALNGFTGNQAG